MSNFKEPQSLITSIGAEQEAYQMRSTPELEVVQAKIGSGFPEAGKDLRAEEVRGGTNSS